MKKFISILTISLFILQTQAQETDASAHKDSNRVVELREIVVNAVKKNPQQQLIHFFKSNNSSTLEDIMSRLPELSLMRRGSYGMEPSIRSFNGGQINVLIDGMRIHGACTDKMDPATIYIEPINLENLQVQTATNGFMNGSSIGGTINMKMAEPVYENQNKLSGMISSGYQTAANSFYEAVKLNYSSGKWAFRVSGTYRNNKNYRSGGGEIIKFSQFEKLNYSLSAKYQQTKYTYLKADILADDGWNIGYPALPMDVGYAAAKIASISLHHERPSTRLYKWQVKMYVNHIRHSMDDTKRPFVPMHMDMPGISKTYGLYTEGELNIRSKQKIVWRADASSTYLKASMTMYQAGQLPMYMLTWPDNRRNQYGISASWVLQIDSSLNVRINGRADFITSKLVSAEAKDQVSIFGYPSASRADLLKNISLQVSKYIRGKFKTTAAITYAERMPTASELYGFYLFNSSDGYDYTGNPKIGLEKSLQAEASVLYNWQKNRIQLTYYYSKVYNFITGMIEPSYSTMTIGANGVKSFVNIPAATVSGVEASGIMHLFTLVDLMTTLRYTTAKDKHNNPLPFIAPLKNVTSLRYQSKKFSAQLESELALKQSRINTSSGEDSTPGYALLHARFGYNTTLFTNNLLFQAGVENMLDKEYHEHLDWGNIPRPGRNIYLQIRLQF